MRPAPEPGATRGSAGTATAPASTGCVDDAGGFADTLRIVARISEGSAPAATISTAPASVARTEAVSSAIAASITICDSRNSLLSSSFAQRA